MKQTPLVLLTALIVGGFGTCALAQEIQPMQAMPAVPDDRSYAQLRGLDNNAGAPQGGYMQPQPVPFSPGQPMGEGQPMGGQPYPAMMGKPPKPPKPPKEHHHHSAVGEATRLPGDAVKSSVGVTDKTAKTGVGMVDHTAKAGVGLTDRAVKTTVGAPMKGVKEVFKAIF